MAAYAGTADFLPDGGVLDLGCGIGHSYEVLAPRRTVGLDVDPTALRGQDRETVAADMRALPFPDRSFASILAVHSIEHVPDPERVLAEVRRVVEPGGVAVFVTPNRLTFARPDEIIDPYHFVEYDRDQLAALLGRWFDEVELHGLHGSDRYLDLLAEERQTLERLLSLDPMRLRRLVPRRPSQRLYDWGLRRARRDARDPRVAAIDLTDFRLTRDRLDECLDLVAVCARPRVAG